MKNFINALYNGLICFLWAIPAFGLLLFGHIIEIAGREFNRSKEGAKKNNLPYNGN